MEPEELLGEYDNVADLMGINMEGDIMGQIARLPREKQSPAFRAVLNMKRPAATIAEANSRNEFEKKFRQLPKDIREGLLKQRLQLADTRYYIVKEIAAKNSIDVFQGTDQKSVALANLANQKTEKDAWFLLSAIRMLYAVSATKENADFGVIAPFIMNGEFEFEAGQKKLVGLISNEAFDTRGRSDVQIGYYKLHSTKIIEPQVEIKMPVKFGAAAPANAWLKVVLIGSSVIPY